MLINTHELNSSSQMRVEQRRMEAEEYRLAKLASGEAEVMHGHAFARFATRLSLRGLLARLRVVRVEAYKRG